MTVTKRVTIKAVWDRKPNGVFPIAVQERGTFTSFVVWTRDAWWASLCERYDGLHGRPTVSIQYDGATRQLFGVILPVDTPDASPTEA
jgi:hypothetical protein